MKLDVSFEINLPGLKSVERNFMDYSQRCRVLASGDGGGMSTRFEERIGRIQSLLVSSNGTLKSDVIHTEFRPLVALLRFRDEIYSQVELSRYMIISLVNSARGMKGRISQLCYLYFEHFDRIPYIAEFTEALKAVIADLDMSKVKGQSLKTFRRSSNLLFSPRGPEFLAKSVVKEDAELLDYTRSMGIAVSGNCRFYERAKVLYFVEEIKEAELGSDLPLITQVQRPEIRDDRYDNELSIGLKVCAVMMERYIAVKESPNEIWRDCIINILGDPRQPATSPNYQRGWGRLDLVSRQYAEMMKSWLSRLDLKLFLQIFYEMSQAENLEDMERMYPPRKRFLEGLAQSKKIKNSRLILSKKAVSYMRSNYPDEFNKLSYLNLKGGNAGLSLIYLQIDDYHLFEGTHNAKVRGFREMPLTGFLNYSRKTIQYSELTRADGGFEVAHYKSRKKFWQADVLRELGEHGITINPELVLSRGDYLIYRRHYTSSGVYCSD